VIPVDEDAVETATSIYHSLNQLSSFQSDVLFDDRVNDGMRLGARIRHLQMIGIPHFVLVGKQSTNEKPTVEIETRSNGNKIVVPVNEIIDTLTKIKGDEIREGIKRARS
jgi:prolyl-tRNA synthetase